MGRCTGRMYRTSRPATRAELLSRKAGTADPGLVFFKDRKTGFVRVEVDAPCGKCESCLSARAQQWAVRCACELQLHQYACFVTLTYDDQHLPPDGKLQKQHLQDFFRAIRDSGEKIRYFACGEYGDNFGRPHYHAIIFGVDFLGEAKPIHTKSGNAHFESPSLSKFWPYGLATTSLVNYSTICYTVGYVAKKISNPDVFQLMSRRPGLGAEWIKLHEDDLRRTMAIVVDGREYPIPKYFFDKEDFDDIKEFRRTFSKSETKSQRDSRAKNVSAKHKRKRGDL